MQHVLITGATGGFGALTAKTLKKTGYQVTGTTTRPDSLEAQELQSQGIQLVKMDIRDDHSVEEAIHKILTNQSVDILIHNAGVGVLGVQELFSSADFHQILDINVVGVQRVNRQILPAMRQKKSGTILYISSLLGRMTMPFYGPYNASKWALEAMAENYRTELGSFGIENCIVEPGGFPTAFSKNLLRPSERNIPEDYRGMQAGTDQMLAGFEQAMEANPEQRPEKVSDVILDLLSKPRGEKPFRTTVDYMGMGTQVSSYNDHLHQMTLGIYTAFGTQGMLELAK